ncbi:MAG TPA: dickkopf-related protein [Polyangia bacterium]|nr:dickkopf-related protein [Polyangia bacterium]
MAFCLARGLRAVVVVVLLPGAAGCVGKASSGYAGNGGQCRVDADCTLGQTCVFGVCATTGVGVAGDKCSLTTDCQSGLYCAPAGQCAPGGTHGAGDACSADATCKPPLRCQLDGFFGACGAPGQGGVAAVCQSTADCAGGLYCGRDKACQPSQTAFPPFAGVVCGDEGPFRVYVEVPRSGRPPADFFRLPFPNDARVSGGKLNLGDFPRPGPSALGVDLVQLYVDAWTADFDGFSAIAPVLFRFSDEMAFESASGDSVLYIDLTPGPTLGQQLGRTWSFNPDAGKFICRNHFALANSAAEPLLPGHTYGAILTTAIKSMAGVAARPDADMTALLAATAPADAGLMPAWTAYQPLRDWLKSKGAAAPDVAAAAVFTVQDAPAHTQHLAAAVAAQPAPVLSALTLCDGSSKSPCDDGTPARACPSTTMALNPAFDEIHGKVRLPIFQAGAAPFATAAEGGGISEGAGGAVTPTGTADVCFALTVPRGATMPAAGWPLTVLAHGTGGSFRSGISDGIAAKLAGAAQPGAVFTIDAVEHGARRGASTKPPEVLVWNPLNPRAARDNVLQGAADILTSFRVAGLSIDAAASPTKAIIKFNPGALTFFGHGQGSTAGELALAVSGAAPAAVLSGAGAYLTESILHRTSPNDVGAGLVAALGEALDETHPVMVLLQSFLDRSDPVSFAPLIVLRPPAAVASKHVFMSWGTGDTYVPVQALTANARALGIPGVAPLLEATDLPSINRPVSDNLAGGDGPKRTAAAFQYAPPTGTGGYDGDFVALRLPKAITDWAAFVASALASGTPAVP